MILYKYRKDTEFTDSIFTENCVWLSTPDKLNDPFECSYNIPVKIMDDHINKAIQAQVAGFLFAYYKKKEVLDAVFGEDNISQLIQRLNNPLIPFRKNYDYFLQFCIQGGWKLTNQTRFFDAFKATLLEIGIFSLSSDIENQLLWAHYADESRGIAIGFSTEESEKLSNEKTCIQVKYNDDFPTLISDGMLVSLSIYASIENGNLTYDNSLNVSDDDPFLRTVVSTKPKAWAYENEWRYIEKIAGKYPLPGSIREIVFGTRCPPETIRKYMELSRQYLKEPISFFKMEKADTQSRFVKSMICY